MHEFIGVIAKEDGTHAALTSGHEDRSERTLAHGEPDVGTRAAGAIA
jgi:hypothetical protein